MSLAFKDYTIQVESWQQVWPELVPMHEKHWEETEVKYLKRPLACNYAEFGNVEARGNLALYTVRHAPTGQMVGNLLFFVSQSLHFAGLVAQEDDLYLFPEHRGTGVARQLIRFAENDLKINRKVVEVFLTSKAPVGGPHVSVLFAGEGYNEVARVYSKSLEG